MPGNRMKKMEKEKTENLRTPTKTRIGHETKNNGNNVRKTKKKSTYYDINIYREKIKNKAEKTEENNVKK